MSGRFLTGWDDDIFSLSGRVAMVTGAAKGLGRELALGMARRGADIAAVDTDAAVNSLVAEIRALGRKAFAACCDITIEDEVRRFVTEAAGATGKIDVLVNNAGINRKALALEQTPQTFEPVLKVNLIGTFHCCQAVGRLMREQGAGSIINMASIGGLAALGRGNNFYGASKAAVISLTRDLALEWAPYGIRVNAIAPGWFATERVENYLRTQSGLRDRMEGVVPLGRLGTPAELVGPAIFLASDASSMMTGQVLIVDGGLLSSVHLGADDLTQ
jgi:gluconate 5-dehydrogenase